MNYASICAEVCHMAQKTGEFIASQRDEFCCEKIEEKGDQNFVSYVDREAEHIIVEELRRIVPEAGFVTEEETVETAGDCKMRWIVDPLDGTTNFIHGLPPYCVSIALMCDDEVVVGVIYEVTLRECFYAWKGSKAYMNGCPIRVSSVTELKGSLVALGFAYNMEERMHEFLAQMEYFQLHTNGVRRIGSAAADLAYVACGRFDAFVQVNLSPWDVAAGALIVQCAGGRVTDLSEGSDYIFGREIIATNAQVYSQFTAELKNCCPKVE